MLEAGLAVMSGTLSVGFFGNDGMQKQSSDRQFEAGGTIRAAIRCRICSKEWKAGWRSDGDTAKQKWNKHWGGHHWIVGVPLSVKVK